MRRFRPALSTACFAVVALGLATSLLTFWAHATVYDSDDFSGRAVQLLDSPAVRHEVADRVTTSLARSGYRPAVELRPALQFAVEVAVDTEAFRSILRRSIESFHEALMGERGAPGGLDLSDALSVVTSTVQLPSDARTASAPSSALGSTLEDVSRRATDLRVWHWQDISAGVSLGALAGALGLSALGLAVAVDRRAGAARLGLAVAAAGVIVLATRALLVLAVRRMVDDAQLGDAVADGLWRATGDLRTLGTWVVGYGAVVTAAASRTSLTPAALRSRLAGVHGWRQRGQSHWLVVAVALVVLGLAITSAPELVVVGLVHLGGLWLLYLGVHEIVSHLAPPLERAAAEGPEGGHRSRERRRVALAGVAVAVLLALVTGGLLTATRRAANDAQVAGGRRCNGSAALCDATLDQVTFPGTHNAMSSSLYPGWLFGEQVNSIAAQLEGGVRALLFDTHYGEPTNVRLPGSGARLVVTDRAAELAAPPGSEVDIDPAVEARAAALRARASVTSGQRAIYLCHNWCEMGAVTFSSVLADISDFLDANPDEVVSIIIQDATTVAETSAAIEASGLADRAATLTKGQPLPTLGQLVDSGKRVLVFAEQGGNDAPPWYMKAYDWFQETGFSFSAIDGFDCKPNRGTADNPLFLVNHWVSTSPPNPKLAGQANTRQVLEDRIRTCLTERGLVPNIIAVDFAGRGDVVAVARALDADPSSRAREPLTTPTTAPSAGSSPVPASTTTTAAPLPPVPGQTDIPTLTGGDATAFCAAAPRGVRLSTAYSVAALSASAEEQGRADLAFGPGLVRTLTDYVRTAPIELATQARPLLERATAAVARLEAAGVDQQVIDEMADQAVTAADDPGVDALALDVDLAERLIGALGREGIATVAAAFAATAGDPTGVLDFGSVSDAVADADGYSCLADALAPTTGR